MPQNRLAGPAHKWLVEKSSSNPFFGLIDDNAKGQSYIFLNYIPVKVKIGLCLG